MQKRAGVPLTCTALFELAPRTQGEQCGAGEGQEGGRTMGHTGGPVLSGARCTSRAFSSAHVL